MTLWLEEHEYHSSEEAYLHNIIEPDHLLPLFDRTERENVSLPRYAYGFLPDRLGNPFHDDGHHPQQSRHDVQHEPIAL